MDDEIYFVPLGITPEIQRRFTTLVDKSLHSLGYHPVLEDRAAKRMGKDLLGGRDAQEITEQAGIVEVRLWALDEPLAEIFELGSKVKQM